MKVIPTLEEHAFLSKAVVCSTGLLPCFVLRRLHIRNEKGCSPCVSSSARRLSPPPPHSLAPWPLLLSIPGTSPGGCLPCSLCWGLGSYSTSQNFLDLLVPCIGGVDRRLSWELLIFLPEQGLPVIPEAALQIVGPQGKPQPRQMGTQAPLLCRQAASGSPLP